MSESNSTGPHTGSNHDPKQNSHSLGSHEGSHNGSHEEKKDQDAKLKTESKAADLQKRIEELEDQVKDKESKFIYLYAEFENFKKRAIKERTEMAKFGCESLARELLGSVDNLERALNHIPQGMDKNFISGIEMVLNELKSTLQRQGIERIESVEKVFDPNFHEAVGQEFSDLPSGTVVREHMGGYTIHGRLLRPARVVVSQGSVANK